MASYSVSSKKQQNTSTLGLVKADTVYMNDGTRICARACACCWDKVEPADYEGKVKYLYNRVRTGHTSVLEHSNHVMLLSFDIRKLDIGFLSSVFEFMSGIRYINIAFDMGSDYYTLYLMMGGSWRAYIHLINEIGSLGGNYPILDVIKKEIYSNIDARIFAECIDNGYMKDYLFQNVEPDPASNIFNPMPAEPLYSSDKVDIISMDSIGEMYSNVKAITGENLFALEDYSKMASITILFKDMSRTGTHQLVRHRNAITQESQRYVDYSHAAFADPTLFKPETYDSSKKYDIKFLDKSFSLTSMEIGEAIAGIYEHLREQGMLKEDARAFLPGNIKCRKLYMTFTYSTFLKFLELRTDPHAQAEIRSFAVSCKDLIKDHISREIDTLMDLRNGKVQNQPDQIISDKEVIMENIISHSDELKEDNKDD